MKVGDLFKLCQGNSFELINMNVDNSSEINFVSRTEKNNGTVAKVKRFDDEEPFSAGSITVALSGSVLSSFVQMKPFYTAFHVMVLTPKQKMRLEEKLFYCQCIKINAYRYGFGRQANKTLKYVNLPPLPEWLKNYTIDYSRIASSIPNRDLPIDTKSWKRFRLDELFIFKKGSRLTKANMKPGNTNFIASIRDNNGIRQKISAAPAHKGNCITVNYNGSVGEAFYQSEPFCASDDVNVLYPKDWNLNKYIGVFIVAVIMQNKYRFGYGRKWKLERMTETTIEIPVDSLGSPDWRFMENYIKSLSKSDLI
jgi:hypothetical protein